MRRAGLRTYVSVKARDEKTKAFTGLSEIASLSRKRSTDHRVLWVYDSKALNDKFTLAAGSRPWRRTPVLEACGVG